MLSFRKIQNPRTIIVSRIDNIGDVIFTFPLVSLLKKKYPRSKIYFLAREYVKDLIEVNSDIDGFLNWDFLKYLPIQESVEILSKMNVDVIVNVFPNTKLAKISKLAGVPFRVSRLSKLRHLLYSNKLRLMSRRDFSVHESELVNKLLNCFEIYDLPSVSEMSEFINLSKPKTISKKVSQFLREDKFNLILHPGSNGNGKEWSAKCHVELIDKLDKEKINIILTGTNSEKDKFQKSILDKVDDVRCAMGKLTLKGLIELISFADGFIGSGTGPTHLSAALDIPTLGLFPKVKQIGIGRWKPLGGKVEILVSETDCK